MKQQYEVPSIDITWLDALDIIATSSLDNWGNDTEDKEYT